MPDGRNAGNNAPTQQQPQAGNAGDPQAGTPAPQAGTDPNTPQAGDESISVEEARRLRRENAAFRTELKKFQDEKKAADDANLSELDKLKRDHAEAAAERDRLKAQLQRSETEKTLALAARKLGIVDEDAAIRLLDWDALEFDPETGKPKNAEAQLKALMQARPWLAAQPGRSAGSADGGRQAGRNGSAGGEDMNTLIRRAAGRL
jgi:hypothetical protein